MTIDFNSLNLRYFIAVWLACDVVLLFCLAALLGPEIEGLITRWRRRR